MRKTTVLCSLFTMPANTAQLERDTVGVAVTWLRDRLPPSWEVGPTQRPDLPGADQRTIDGAIDLRGPNGTFTTMAVEVKQRLGPRDVDRLLDGFGKTLRIVAGNVSLLVVAPWLSRRTQELLREAGLNYLDLTGNAFVRIENPTLFIETQGKAKDPFPAKRSKAGLQGPKAGRLVRFLTDVRPPYGVRELAASASLAPGYVSRLLDTLDDEALVERSKRGRVESVDLARLLRRWAETYDVFRTNGSARYLAPAGAKSVVARLSSLGSRVAITGSFAAVRLAPVAGPALLALYADSPADLASSLDLIPTDDGANVVLLTPFDPVVWERTTTDEEMVYVAPSQAAVDCLTGNGRMPAEGEALLQWMTEHENRWRALALPPQMMAPAP